MRLPLKEIKAAGGGLQFPLSLFNEEKKEHLGIVIISLIWNIA
jgi:hypothetical protein